MESFHFKLPTFQKERLEEIKRKTGKSISEQIREAVDQYLDKNTKYFNKYTE